MPKRFSRSEVSSFLRNASILLKAGLPVSRIIDMLGARYSTLPIDKISCALMSGQGFAEGLRSLKVEPGLVNNIKLGEANGNLEGSLLRAAEMMERQEQVKRGVMRALTYPMMIMTLSLLTLTGFMLFVLPTFSSLFSDSNIPLPALTRIVIALPNYVPFYVIAAIFLALAVMFGIKNDAVKIRLPLTGTIWRDLNLAKYLRALGEQVNGAVPILSALEANLNVCDNNFTSAGQRIYREVEQGQSLNSTFLKFPKLFPQALCQMVAVGEESGRLGEMLILAAEYYEGEAEGAIKRAVTYIEPAATLAVGFVVGIIAFAMMLPMFSMINMEGLI